MTISRQNLSQQKKIENSGLEPESNVFEVRISYPPTQEDKSKINKINEVDSLFPDNLMIPSIETGSVCKCGYEWLDPTLGDCESTNVNIHHSKTTSDSRNSSLILLYRKTSNCTCKLLYSGEEDKLLRV